MTTPDAPTVLCPLFQLIPLERVTRRLGNQPIFETTPTPHCRATGRFGLANMQSNCPFSIDGRVITSCDLIQGSTQESWARSKADRLGLR